MEKVWEIKDPDALMKEMKKKRVREEMPLPDEKDPAKAYTQSLILWGSGQLHNDQLIKGVLFLSVMVVLLIGTFASILFQTPLLRFLRSRGFSLSELFLYAEILAFCAILFWQFNAGDAYHGAARTRRRRFKGVLNRVQPPLCSLLVPGWGQFLNGQQIKGSIFSGFTAFSYFSILAVLATLLAWPYLDASGSRVYVDEILAGSLLFLPLIPFVWLFSFYDALMVSRDELLKESLWERIKAANNRRRTEGWIRGVFSRFKPAFLLTVFLGTVGIAIYYFVTMDYLVGSLTDARTRLASQGMTVAPDLIGRVSAVLQEVKGRIIP